MNRKFVAISSMLAAVTLMAGCSSPATESTPSAGSTPMASADNSTTPSLNNEADDTVEHASTILFISDAQGSYGINFDGEATGEGTTLELDRNLTGQIKEAIRDSSLRDLKKVSNDNGNCAETDTDSISVIVPEWEIDGSATPYYLCEFEEGTEDPLFDAAEKTFEEIRVKAEL